MSNQAGLAPDRWQTAIEGSKGHAFFLLDSAGTVLTATEGATALLGYQPAGLAGRPWTDLFPEQPKDASSPSDLLASADRVGHAPIARNLLRKNGTDVPVEGSIAASPGGYTVVLWEGTDRQKLQRASDRVNAELQQFAFTVSHDMKAPLRSVKSFSELLERRYKGQLDQDATDYIGYVVDGARQMEQLLNDIVAYSQAGREDKTKPQVIDATGVLQWALMNVDAPLKAAGGTLTHSQLPSVVADQSQLAQIFQHLLTNSIKFRSEQPLAIQVESVPVDDNWVQFSIRDNGIGVDPVYHERIFGVFKRLHGREIPGTGIGLAICRKIVEAHGGRISIESEPGKGTTMRFTLPAA